MTQAATNYAKVLFETETPIEDLREGLTLLESQKELKKVLASPAVYQEDKVRLIKKIFPKKMQALLVTLCKYDSMSMLGEVVKAYESYLNQLEDVLEVTLYYVTKPSKERLEELKGNLLKKYQKKDVSFDLVEEPSLIGGFKVKIGDTEYDYSLARQIKQMKQALNRTEVK